MLHPISPISPSGPGLAATRVPLQASGDAPAADDTTCATSSKSHLPTNSAQQVIIFIMCVRFKSYSRCLLFSQGKVKYFEIWYPSEPAKRKCFTEFPLLKLTSVDEETLKSFLTNNSVDYLEDDGIYNKATHIANC
jgi:hypothetical protein